MRVRRLLPAIILAPLGALALACGTLDGETPGPTPIPTAAPGILVNGGFEDGEAPWTYRVQPEWSGFEIADDPVRSGERSLRLSLRDPGDASNVHIAGAVQEVRPAEFPEFVSGYYRVEGWEPRDVTFQYVQFVVIVYGADYGDDFNLHEIRFPLAGAPREPFQLLNAKWVFLSRDQPKTGKWVYFGYPLRQAFIDKWGKAPDRWDRIELFLEVRYDGRTAADAGMSADVYFDDVYLGPWPGNPNRP
jgi:hypothetical protein